MTLAITAEWVEKVPTSESKKSMRFSWKSKAFSAAAVIESVGGYIVEL